MILIQSLLIQFLHHVVISSHTSELQRYVLPGTSTERHDLIAHTTVQSPRKLPEVPSQKIKIPLRLEHASKEAKSKSSSSAHLWENDKDPQEALQSHGNTPDSRRNSARHARQRCLTRMEPPRYARMWWYNNPSKVFWGRFEPHHKKQLTSTPSRWAPFIIHQIRKEVQSPKDDSPPENWATRN